MMLWRITGRATLQFLGERAISPIPVLLTGVCLQKKATPELPVRPVQPDRKEQRERLERKDRPERREPPEQREQRERPALRDQPA